MDHELFINSFQKGSSENANLGFGVMLGIENYTKKGVAQLTKDTTKISGSTVTDLPIFICSKDGDTYFIQGDTGKVYKYIVSTNTLTDISPSADTGAGNGKGLVFFDNVLYEFIAGKIKFLLTPYTGGGSWVDWSPSIIGSNVLNSSIHTAFIFPSAYGFYFCNGNSVGLVQEKVSGTQVDPTDSSTYNVWYQIFTLPPLYTINTLSFLPPNQLMMGTGSATDQTVADIIGWDTISTNKFSPPLRLYSQAQIGENGVKQLINRNNVLYAITGGNHGIFATQGGTFTNIADLSLYSNIRTTGGSQVQIPIFLSPKIGAIDIFGNKLLTGVSTPSNISSYPAQNGLYPAGVWSVAFTDEGESVQCEYSISTNTVVATNTFTIGALKCIGNNQTLIGWQDGTRFGIDLVSTSDFQNTIANVAIESEMMEIGTPLDPAVIPTIQVNVPRPLITGQTIQVNGRSGFEQNYIPLQTFTSIDGNSLKIVQNPLGAIKFLQLQLQMASTISVISTPEIRNTIISKS